MVQMRPESTVAPEGTGRPDTSVPDPGSPDAATPDPGLLPWARRAPGYPFRGPGWAGRVLPFAALAVLAEASLALPPGSSSTVAGVASAVLLAVTAAAFALPWARLPGWAPVLIPLCYTGSVLALIIAAGDASGVVIVALVPIVWAALFQRRWESGVVVAGVVVAVIVYSLVPSAGLPAVIARRVIFWVALGVLISVATHGLRQRIRRSQAERARLQQRLHEVSLMRDRDRIARDLQEQVIQRIFTASLSLQAARSLIMDCELGRRIEGVTVELDEATRLVRQSIFGLRDRPGGSSLRRDVLELCGEFAPALGSTPDVSFAGGIDGAFSERTAGNLVEALRETLTAIGQQPGPVHVAVSATAAGARLTVMLPGPWPSAGARRTAAAGVLEAGVLRDVARGIGATVEAGAAAGGGTWLAWQLPGGPAEAN
jgi:signal transduction histidine kinase